MDKDNVYKDLMKSVVPASKEQELSNERIPTKQARFMIEKSTKIIPLLNDAEATTYELMLIKLIENIGKRLGDE